MIDIAELLALSSIGFGLWMVVGYWAFVFVGVIVLAACFVGRRTAPKGRR